MVHLWNPYVNSKPVGVKKTNSFLFVTFGYNKDN